MRSHADSHWDVTGSDEYEVWRTAQRRTAALAAIERAAAAVVHGEDEDSDGDDARRGSERLNMWRAAVASGVDAAEELQGNVENQDFFWRLDNVASWRQRVDRATFITARMGPPDIEAALADIIAGLPAEPCRCLGTAALFFWIDKDGNLIAQEN
ncbi:hypothetical protein HK405_006708, partial [Cladochytrium tenue]